MVVSKVRGPKVIGLTSLAVKKYDYLDKDSSHDCLGKLEHGFIMIVWGQSGHGKSNFLMQFIKWLIAFGNILYIGLEEGTGATMQMTAFRHLNEKDHGGKIFFADHEMNYDHLVVKLKKKKSPQFIIIDSLQYWAINYVQYKHLKEMFPKKSFIFISHARGKNPDGKTADKIRYDAGIKVRVEGYMAFPVSRYGGNKPNVIWEEGAIKYYGRKRFNQLKKG